MEQSTSVPELSTIVATLNRDSVDREDGVEMLKTFLYSEETRDTVQKAVTAGILPGLVAILESGSTPEIRTQAAFLFSPIAGEVGTRKLIIEAGGVAPLVELLKTGMQDAKLAASNVLWNVALQETEVRKYMVQVGCVEALLELCKVPNATIQANAAGCMACVAYELAEEVYDKGTLNVMLDMMETGTGAGREGAADCIGSMCLGPPAALIIEHLPTFLEIYNRVSTGDDMRRSIVRIFYNMSAYYTEGRQKMLDAKVVDIVKTWIDKGPDEHDPSTYVTANMCVANLVGHIENHPLLTSSGDVITEILSILKATLDGKLFANRTWLLWAPLQGIANLSINDQNKEYIVNAGAVPHLTRALQEAKEPRAEEFAAKTLSNLSFAIDIREHTPDVDQALRAVAEGGKSKLGKEFAKLALFQIGQRSKEQGENKILRKKHIFLSFSESQEPLAEQLETFLKEKEYSVWRRNGNELGRISMGIEDAQVVVLGLCPEFKNSECCRTEAEYATRLNKPLISMAVGGGAYSPDGWLKALIGSQHVIPCPVVDDDKASAIVCRSVLDELRRRKITPNTPEITEAHPEMANHGALAMANKRADDAEKEVLRLQNQINMSDFTRFREEVDNKLQTLEDQIVKLTDALNQKNRRRRCCAIM